MIGVQPSIEEALRAIILAELIPGQDSHVGKVIPDDLANLLPYVSVVRIGGPRGALVDYPLVDVDVFDSTDAGADGFAQQVDRVLNGSQRVKSVRVGDGSLVVLDDVFANRQFATLPWDGDEHRYSATYDITMRRR